MPLHAPGEQKATPSASEILFLFGFREIDSSVTRSLQPGVLGETDLHGNKSSTVEEKKEKGRKNTAATTGKPQELPKVVFPLFSIPIGDMCSEICTNREVTFDSSASRAAAGSHARPGWLALWAPQDLPQPPRKPPTY